MGTGHLTLDLGALAQNWRTLDGLSRGETAAVVKADGYGMGAVPVARRLMREGVRSFFVAATEEGAALRQGIGDDAQIFIFSGHMPGDADLLRAHRLTPLLNSVDQMLMHVEALPGHDFGIQLDTGMNRLGMEPNEWVAVKDIALSQKPRLVMSHLACADEPNHPMNARQLQVFRGLTDGLPVRRSLAATGGILLGPDYHFDLTRPGVGLYGGAPFTEAAPVVTLDIPVIQIRALEAGETVGYGNAWTAPAPTRIATISAGYADGLIRAMGAGVQVFAGSIALPVVGRVSMDLITVDVSALDHEPETLQLLGAYQTVDAVADAAGTIGYEILTSLGARYARTIRG